MSKIDINVYDFIQNLIHEQGYMTFGELRKLSGLSNAALLSIENNLRKEHLPILRKGRCYFVKDFDKIKQSMGSTQEDSLKILQYEWEKIGAKKLTEVFNFPDLSRLIDGDIRYAFKKLRQEYTGSTRNSFTKKELAHILILFHGRDLLADKKIRFSVARACGIQKRTVPQRWMPGSFSSRNFIKLVDFPSEFSGIKAEN